MSRWNVHVRSFRRPGEIESALHAVDVDPGGVGLMSPKAEHYVITAKSVDVRAANLVKQEMLALGGDSANSRGTIDFSDKTTDLLLMGTLKMFRQLAKKLKAQPFHLTELGEEILAAVERSRGVPPPLRLGTGALEFGGRTYVMGILNVTPDSFSDGGKFLDVDSATDQARRMVAEGADLIDLGGESTRPGSQRLGADEELRRVLPVLERIRGLGVPISIDTSKADVAGKAIELGATMVNDITALQADPLMAKVVADRGVPVVLMHMQGTPETMQVEPTYRDPVPEILRFLRDRIAHATAAGIATDRIVVDPGIGFGKSSDHNVAILRRLREFRSLGHPVLIGLSRKGFIGKILEADVNDRLEGTIAAGVAAVLDGADIVRVHDVLPHVRALRVADRLLR